MPLTVAELRVGLAVGVGTVTLGGDAELLVTNLQRGELLGSIPAGTSWTAIADSAGVHLVRPDGSRTPSLRSVSVVAVTEGRHVVAIGRRYRGRVTVFRDTQGLTAGVEEAARKAGVQVTRVEEPSGLPTLLAQIPLTVRLQVLALRYTKERGTDPDLAIVAPWDDADLWAIGSPRS